MSSDEATEEQQQRRRPSFARNTAIFSTLTAASRVAGLAREVLAARLFGLSTAASAFTLAFQIPNVVRALFADAALSAAFVPVFTELQEKGKKQESFRLATTLLALVTLVLTAVVLLFMVLAPVIVPLFQGSHTTDAMIDLAVPLSRIMFPIVLILGVNGLVVGILHAYEHFTIPALSPVVWNIVIMFFMVAAQPLAATSTGAIYGYAIGVLVGTVVQLGMALPMLRRVGFHFASGIDFRDPRIKQVIRLVIPVALGLGLINFNALINTVLAGHISDAAVAGVDKAFRLYMLPQGMFSVAISTVLFPRLARLAARQDFEGMQQAIGTGMRLILLLLLPATAAMIVMPTAITRVVYEGGEFTAQDTHLVSVALLFYSFSLIFSGMNLLLSRSFFSLQRPWAVTWLSLGNLIINLTASWLIVTSGGGIGGLVLGTAIADAAMAVGQIILLRRALGGRLQLGTMRNALVTLVVGTVWFGIAAFATYHGLDWLLGRSTPSQIIAVGGGLAAGVAAYAYVVLTLGLPEAAELERRVRSRLGS